MVIEKIPNHILWTLLEVYDREEIEELTPDQCFDAYCSWHGLINWSPKLIEALDSLRNARKTE